MRRVRSFLAVAENASFSIAARILGLTQPAVSQHVKQLEEQLDIPLLIRDREGLRMTPAGTSLLPAFRRLLASNGAILDQLASLGTGTEQILRIASPASYASQNIARAFQDTRAAFPSHIMDITELDDEESIQLVMNGDIDFAITSVYFPAPGVHFEPLLRDAACVVMPADSPLAGLERLRDEDVLSQPIVRFPSGTTSHGWLTTLSKRSGLVPQIAAEVRQLFTGLQMIRQGLGIAILAEGSARLWEDPALVMRPLSDAGLMRTLGIVRSDAHHPTAFESALVDNLRGQSSV